MKGPELPESRDSGAVKTEGSGLEAIGGRLRDERRARDLSLDAAARLTGVSKAMLSAIERGEKTPTIRVLVAIVEAYGTNISSLLHEDAAGSAPITVVRWGERSRLVDPRSQVVRELLSPTFLARGIEVLWFEIPEGARNGPLPPRHTGVRQHVTVATGSLQLTVNGNTETLGLGDSADFDADAVHTFTNVGSGICAFFLVLDTAPRPGS